MQGWRLESSGDEQVLHNGVHRPVTVTGDVVVTKVFSRNFWLADPESCESALGSLTNPGGEFLDVIEDLAAFLHFGQDLALGVHDGGVVATEGLTDLGK